MLFRVLPFTLLFSYLRPSVRRRLLDDSASMRSRRDLLEADRELRSEDAGATGGAGDSEEGT